MAIDINTVIENLNELLTNSVNLTDKYYDLFINPEPMMIDLELYNEDNQLVVVTVPNRAMDRENFGQLIDKVDALAEVATTGEYIDLKNVPEGILTIQQNGSTVATFNNNNSTDVTANIIVPTEVEMSGMSMPSNTYTDLTLGASGTAYTAPANGWFFLRKYSNDVNQFIGLYHTAGDGVSSEVVCPLANTDNSIYIPVRKGQIITCYYSMGGATAEFRFIYATGSKSEAQ